MAGRGRGRGKQIGTLSNEQLGIGKEIQSHQVSQPPPNFPPLSHKAAKPEISDELNYLVTLKSGFAEYMKESPYYVEPVVIKKDIDRYSDKYDGTVKSSYESLYDWSRMPAELRPPSKKRKGVSSSRTSTKRMMEVNVEEKLKELEKKETDKDFDNEEDLDEEDDKDENDPDEPMDEDDVDEEMDDGTDYAKDYFDNGEGYDDEEDNNEDGPVY